MTDKQAVIYEFENRVHRAYDGYTFSLVGKGLVILDDQGTMLTRCSGNHEEDVQVGIPSQEG